MSDLIERIEAADELQYDGGYALDGEIAKLLGWSYGYRDATHRWGWCRPGTTTHFDAMPPAFTTKIDAALSLVPEGLEWELFGYDAKRDPRFGRFQARIKLLRYEDDPEELGPQSIVDAATPALALCAAA